MFFKPTHNVKNISNKASSKPASVVIASQTKILNFRHIEQKHFESFNPKFRDFIFNNHDQLTQEEIKQLKQLLNSKGNSYLIQATRFLSWFGNQRFDMGTSQYIQQYF